MLNDLLDVIIHYKGESLEINLWKLCKYSININFSESKLLNSTEEDNILFTDIFTNARNNKNTET